MGLSLCHQLRLPQSLYRPTLRESKDNGNSPYDHTQNHCSVNQKQPAPEATAHDAQDKKGDGYFAGYKCHDGERLRDPVDPDGFGGLSGVRSKVVEVTAAAERGHIG